jgi:hypothetical protein
MKNEVYFLNNNIFESIHALWKSELFKKAHNKEGSFVNVVAKKISEQRICLYEFTDEKLEKRHMTPWFNHIGLRNDYNSEIIHDLYLIHEFYHIAYLPDYTKIHYDFDNWKETMWHNELMSSLATEVFIYIWMPELRKETFGFEIWFDLLKTQYGFDFSNLNLKSEHVFKPEKVKELSGVIDLRLAFRNGKEATNEPEEWFVRYNNYNKWFERWRDDYLSVQELRKAFNQDMDLFVDLVDKHKKDNIIFNFNKS